MRQAGWLSNQGQPRDVRVVIRDCWADGAWWWPATELLLTSQMPAEGDLVNRWPLDCAESQSARPSALARRRSPE